jgi:hypothetical protein
LIGTSEKTVEIYRILNEDEMNKKLKRKIKRQKEKG